MDKGQQQVRNTHREKNARQHRAFTFGFTYFSNYARIPNSPPLRVMSMLCFPDPTSLRECEPGKNISDQAVPRQTDLQTILCTRPTNGIHQLLVF